LIAELVVSWRLLRLPGDVVLDRAYALLAQRQAPDGSWGTTGSQKLHLTLVATLATLEHIGVPRDDIAAF
jgi:hypothetical protein